MVRTERLLSAFIPRSSHFAGRAVRPERYWLHYSAMNGMRQTIHRIFAVSFPFFQLEAGGIVKKSSIFVHFVPSALAFPHHL